MRTYYVRQKMDIDDATYRKLWDERRIAVHYPRYKMGDDPKGIIPSGRPDNPSINPDDYPRRGKNAIRSLTKLAANGGYVCAEAPSQPEVMLGYVPKNSRIELVRGQWGSTKREAVLKSLKLRKVRLVHPCDFAVIAVGRPRQGAIMRWRRAGKTIENAVEGRPSRQSVDVLSYQQQEVMCSEFLRLKEAADLGLPRLACLLLPVGRTMKDIDIYGLSDSGKMILGQVTYLSLGACGKKKKALLSYADAGRNALVLFCRCNAPTRVEGIRIAPIQSVYDHFRRHPVGRSWLKKATPSLSSR